LIPNVSGSFVGANYSGIILDGRNNILKNSTIAYSSGNGVQIVGTGHRRGIQFADDDGISHRLEYGLRHRAARHLAHQPQRQHRPGTDSAQRGLQLRHSDSRSRLHL
jgi:hypothetical protein